MNVSVIIPLFDKKPWVKRCLDSVAAQTCRHFEVVVVDDGSTDGGGEEVLALRDPRFRVVRQENRGEGAARNRGLRETHGGWVAFLDADDAWRPEFLEATLARVSADPGLSTVFTNLDEGDPSRPLLQTTGDGPVPDYFAFVAANREIGMTSSSTVIRRSTLAAAGEFREQVLVGADQDTWARVAWCGRVSYIARPLATSYPGLPGSATTRGRATRPPFPSAVRSFREWRDARRIPEALRTNSARFANRLTLDHAAALINRGLRMEALRTLVGECEARSWREVRHWTLLARLALPLRAANVLRALRSTATTEIRS